jgi:hypothetical protein
MRTYEYKVDRKREYIPKNPCASLCGSNDECMLLLTEELSPPGDAVLGAKVLILPENRNYTL